jgi:uncharacterized cupin superfamily protein
MTDRAAELRRILVRNVNDETGWDGYTKGTLYESRGISYTAGLALKDIGLAVDVVPPGKRNAPYHLHHGEEEVFLILAGRGTLRVAGEMLPVAEGDLICIPAGREYPHHLINTSDAPLKFLSISTRRSPEVCEYPDSGKVNAYGGGRILIQRKADSLDYWDGEPGAQ